MWFKQAKVFKLAQKYSNDIKTLEEKLEPLQFKECLPSFPASHGWIAPVGVVEDAPLVHAANGYYLACMQLEEKILPTAVINKAFDERVTKIRLEQDRKLSRKEKQNLKEDIYRALLPQAFSKLSRFYMMFDVKNGLIIIDNTSANKLEKCLSLLKKSLGDDVCSVIETKKTSAILTHWLSKDDYPSAFSIEDNCVLKDPKQQTRVVRLQKQDLSSAAIHAFLKEGLEVNQLLLNWQDKMSFTLSDDFSLKTIKYHGDLLDLAKDQYTETPEQQFDADFYIMSESLTQLLSDLFSVFLKQAT